VEAAHERALAILHEQPSSLASDGIAGQDPRKSKGVIREADDSQKHACVTVSLTVPGAAPSCGRAAEADTQRRCGALNWARRLIKETKGPVTC